MSSGLRQRSLVDPEEGGMGQMFEEGSKDAMSDYPKKMKDNSTMAWLRWLAMVAILGLLGVGIILAAIFAIMSWSHARDNGDDLEYLIKGSKAQQAQNALILAGGCTEGCNMQFMCSMVSDCPDPADLFKNGVDAEVECSNQRCQYLGEVDFFPFAVPGAFADHRCQNTILDANSCLKAEAIFAPGTFVFLGCEYHNPCGGNDEGAYQFLVRGNKEVQEEAKQESTQFDKLNHYKK